VVCPSPFVLQFLTLNDYLMRNFHLFRLEATYEIKQVIIHPPRPSALLSPLSSLLSPLSSLLSHLCPRHSESLGVEYDALYLLELPSLKFFTATLLNVALSAALTTLPPPSTPDDDGRTVGSYLIELSDALSVAASAYVGRLVDGAPLENGNLTAGGGLTGDGGGAYPHGHVAALLVAPVEVAWPALPQVGWQQSAGLLLLWLASAVWHVGCVGIVIQLRAWHSSRGRSCSGRVASSTQRPHLPLTHFPASQVRPPRVRRARADGHAPLVRQHGQSGRLGGATAGHHGFFGLHLKA